MSDFATRPDARLLRDNSTTKHGSDGYDIIVIALAVAATVAFQNDGWPFEIVKVASLLAIVVAGVRGIGTGVPRDSPVPVGAFAFAATVVVLLSALNAVARGVTPNSWLTDAVAPLTIALSVLAATAIARSASVRAVELALSLIGLLAAAFYAMYWLSTRNLTAEAGGTGLASWYAPLGAAVFHIARARKRGLMPQGWIYAAVVVALLVSSGSRLALVPVGLAALWVLVRPLIAERRALRKWRKFVAALATLATIVIVLAATGLAHGPGTDRFLSSFDLARTGLSEDMSFRGRVVQTQVAMAAVETSPLIGVGPGYVYEWTSPPTLRHLESPVSESPAGVVADFGYIGATVLGGLIGALGLRSFLRLRQFRGTLESPADEAIVVVCTAAFANALVSSPFDDKGLAIVLTLLLCRTFQLKYANAVAPALGHRLVMDRRSR